MRKICVTALLALSTAAYAADRKNEYDIRPGEAKVDSAPTAVAWQNDNDARLAAETCDAALAEVVATAENARRLLAEVKGAYRTDAMAATKIAAVSQWVMGGDAWYEFWKPSRDDGRKIWTRALLDRVRTSSDSYVRQFCLDQLRWCGYPCQAGCIRAVAAQESQREVKDLAEMTAMELEH